jgi:hypothetical protein
VVIVVVESGNTFSVDVSTTTTVDRIITITTRMIVMIIPILTTIAMNLIANVLDSECKERRLSWIT